MDPFPAICHAMRNYGPGQRATAESFTSRFDVGNLPVGIPLQLNWPQIHVIDADQVWEHQRASRGVRAFTLPPEIWGDHPEPNDIAPDALWRYAPGGGVTQSGGGPYVSLSVSLISADP